MRLNARNTFFVFLVLTNVSSGEWLIRRVAEPMPKSEDAWLLKLVLHSASVRHMRRDLDWGLQPQPVVVHKPSGHVRPTIETLQQAFAESDRKLLESIWDVKNARFVDIRNKAIVGTHSLAGRDDGRLRRLSRLIRPERLATWLKTSPPVTASVDGLIVLVHLKMEAREPVLETTSLQLRRQKDGWRIVALVHALQGC